MNFPGHSHFFKTQLPEHNKMALAADVCMDSLLTPGWLSSIDTSSSGDAACADIAIAVVIMADSKFNCIPLPS